MAKQTYTPFGRGTLFDKTVVQGAYDNLKVMTDTTNSKMDDSHVPDDSGIPEIIFNFDSSGVHHNHKDGSLSDGAIGSTQIDNSTPRRCQFVLTQSPGTLMLFGRTPSFPANDDGVEIKIEFAGTSEGRSAFPVGSTPIVLLTIYDELGIGLLGTGTYAEARVIDVTSSGFTFKYFTNYAVAGDLLYLFYVAMAQAPGYITSSIGVSV